MKTISKSIEVSSFFLLSVNFLSNIIYHNTFSNNLIENAYDLSNNTWDAGYPLGGNYWDDYTGEDANGDGIGDIAGIISRLDYIQDMGFETIWFSPFFQSPQQDHGYDVSNYVDIAKEYGDMELVDSLIVEAHRRGIRVVFDLVLNHSSIQHPWFKESKSSRDNPKADWYVWRDGKNGEPPNNWKHIPGQKPAWNYDRQRDQWYYAAFLPFQPDLNMNNPEVKKAMFDMVRFWLDKGVDGFRLDIFNFIFEDTSFADNPGTLRMLPDMVGQKWLFEEHKYNMNRPENSAFAKELRAVLEEYDNPQRFLVGEVFGNHATLRRLLGEKHYDGLNLVFLFDFLDDFEFSAAYFKEKVSMYEKFYPEPYVPAYVFSNHDQFRSITRLDDNPEKAKLLALFQLTVRGATFTYQGEEIGMTTGAIPVEEGQDPLAQGWKQFPEWLRNNVSILLNRDNCRTPMQWSTVDNAGFSTPGVKTWLPVQSNYPEINVESSQKDPNSLLNVYRQLLKIKKENQAINHGALEIWEDNLPSGILAYTRKSGNEEVLVVLNFSGERQLVTLEDDQFKTEFFSINSGDDIRKGEVELSPFGGMLIR